MNHKEITEALELVQTILGQWLRYRQYYLKGVGNDPITMQEEAEFLETTSAIAQNVRRLGQRLDDKKFPTRKDQIASQIKGTVSIQSFRNMNEADRKKCYKEWYVSMVYLTRTVGALKFQSEGYRPPEKGKGKGKKKGGFPIPMPVIIVAVVLVLVIGLVMVYQSL